MNFTERKQEEWTGERKEFFRSLVAEQGLELNPEGTL